MSLWFGLLGDPVVQSLGFRVEDYLEVHEYLSVVQSK